MSKSIKLTDRAFNDLAEIENYSIKKWGNKVANKYLGDIEASLNLLQDNAGLLQKLEPSLMIEVELLFDRLSQE